MEEWRLPLKDVSFVTVLRTPSDIEKASARRMVKRVRVLEKRTFCRRRIFVQPTLGGKLSKRVFQKGETEVRPAEHMHAVNLLITKL